MSSALSLDDVELILGLAVRAGESRFLLAALEEPFRRLSGRGVTIRGPSPNAEWDESLMDATEQERTSVDVDLRQMVEEGLSDFGFSVARDGSEALRIVHPDVPREQCAIILPLRRELGALELRARYPEPLVVRVYVGQGPSTGERVVEQAMGIFSLRLRDLNGLELESLREAAKAAKVANAAFGLPAGGPTPMLSASAVPDKVIEYATRAEATQFESATAMIFDALFDTVLPLGSRLAGKPVPDGILLEEERAHDISVALYDCKSKKNEARYTFKPEDGDQFSRYLKILEDCKEQDWKAEGLLVATSDADPAVLDERMSKEIWSRLASLRLIIVPAGMLLRWHKLAAAEGAAFRGRIDSHLVWRALWHGELPGVPRHRLSHYFPRRDIGYQVLTLAEAELVWLAGATSVRPPVSQAFAQLQRTSAADRIAGHKRPLVVNIALKVLGARDGVTLAELCSETGLTLAAVEFLLEGDAFGDLHPEDIGDWFARNRRRLLAEIGAS